KSPGNRHDYDEGFQPGLKIRDHKMIDQNDRQDQSRAHRYERLAHRLALTANYDLGAGRQLAETVDRCLHGVGRAAEIAPADATVHVDYSLHRVVGDDGRIDPVMNRRDVTEELYRRAGLRGGSVRERCIGYLVDRLSKLD